MKNKFKLLIALLVLTVMLVGCGSHPLSGEYDYQNGYISYNGSDIPFEDEDEPKGLGGKLIIKGSNEDNLTYSLSLKTGDVDSSSMFEPNKTIEENGDIEIIEVDGTDIYFSLENTAFVGLYKENSNEIYVAIDSSDEYLVYLYFVK